MAKNETARAVHISHSQITEFVQCPRRYYLHRRLGLPPEFQPAGLVFGSAVHEAIARFHQMRLEGKRAPVDDLMSAFRRHWEGESWPVRFGTGESAESLEALARRMLDTYVADPRTVGTPLAVEEPFEIVLGEDIPPVHGRIDLVEITPEGGLVLTDFKTAGSRREPDADQLVLYREALRVLDYPGGDRAVVRYVVLLKTKACDLWVVEPDIGPGHLPKLRNLYAAVWDDIERGCSCPRTGWWCADCQWKRHCDQA